MQTDTPAVRLVDAQDATSYLPCKRPGCVEPSAQVKGMYGRLCRAHTDEARGAKVGTVRAPSSPAPAGEGYEGLARQLVAVGRDLDRAKARYRPARDTFEAAMAEWRATVQRIAAGPGG